MESLSVFIKSDGRTSRFVAAGPIEYAPLIYAIARGLSEGRSDLPSRARDGGRRSRVGPEDLLVEDDTQAGPLRKCEMAIDDNGAPVYSLPGGASTLRAAMEGLIDS